MSTKIQSENKEKLHENVSTFGDGKKPHLDKIVFRIVKRDELLSESSGAVTRKVNLGVDGPLENTEGTCFCPKIFGYDRNSMSQATNRNLNNKEESFKLKSNIGHIKMPVPITHPGAINKKFLQKLFSLTDVNTFVEVSEWKSFVVRPFFEDDRVMSIFKINSFIEKNVEAFKKEKDIKIIELNNSFKYAPKVSITKLENGKIKIGLLDSTKKTSVLVTDSLTNHVVNYDGDGILDRYVSNMELKITLGEHKKASLREKTVPFNNETLNKGERKLINILNESRVYNEKIIVLQESIFSSIKQSSSDTNFIKKLTEEYQMLTGSYALYDLLSDIDVDREIRYLNQQLEVLKDILNMPVESSKMKDVPHEERKLLRETRERVKSISLQYRMMVSLKRQNCSPTELVSDLIPVISLEHRNRNLISTNKSKLSYRDDKINKFYNDMIEDSGSLWDITLPTYEDLNFKNLNPSEKRLEVYENKIRDSLGNMTEEKLVNRMRKIQSKVVENIITSKNNTDKDFKPLLKRIGSKTGKARSDAQGKRVDISARGVITPNSVLELDEIGIPYDILKVHFKKQLVASIYRNVDNKGVSKEKIEELIDTLGDRFNNKIRLDDGQPATSHLNVKFVNKDITDNFSNVVSMERLILDTLKEIVDKNRYLAIRFPTLHHLNGLGYKIKIVFSQTIHLNPLVCGGYNADFDGDQMSIFLLSLPESIKEVDEIISPVRNDMGSDGRPLMTPTQDMIMGLYLLTLKDKDYENQKVVAEFPNYDRMMSAYNKGKIDLEDKVRVLMPSYDNSIFSRDYTKYKINKLSNKKEYKFTDIETTPKAVNTVFKSQGVEFSVDNYIGNNMQFTEKGFKYIHPPMRDELSKPIALKWEQLNNKPCEMGIVESTVGRFILNSLIPQDLGLVDREKDKFSLEWDTDSERGILGKDLSMLITKIFRKYSSEVSSYVRDLFKDNGYHYVTLSGVSLSLEDIKTSSVRDDIVQKTYDIVKLIELQYDGKEQEDRIIKAWEDATQEIKDKSMRELDDRNPVKMMAISGARGKDTQIAQMIGIRGIMMDAENNKIPVPILENFSEGLSPISYITSSYGSCKGIIDRSNKTAETGDLARHLIFGNSSVIITDGDCGDTTGYNISYYPEVDVSSVPSKDLFNKVVREDINLMEPNRELTIPAGTLIDPNNEEHVMVIDRLISRNYKASKVIPISRNIIGRTPTKDIIDKNTGFILFHRNIPITENEFNQENFKTLDRQYMAEGINVRSIQTCKSGTKGYCARCFGYLFPKHRYTNIGDSVGTFVAHSLSEPGTQMTMRTFHTGGVADGDTSAGFEQFKSTILFAKIPGLDKKEMMADSTLNTNDAFGVTRSKLEELGNYIHEHRRGNLEETLKHLEYPSDYTHENFGLSKLELWQDMFNLFYKSIRDPMIANGLDRILSVNFEVTARQATSNLIIVDSGDSDKATGQTIKIKDLIQTNLALLYKGHQGIIAVPTIDGFKSVIPDVNDPTKSLIFQNVVERITELIMMGAEDDLTNPMTALTVGNVMPLGESISYYKEKLPAKEDITTIFDILDEKETSSDDIEPFKEEQAPKFTPEIAIVDPTVEIVEEEEEISTEEEEVGNKENNNESPFEHQRGVIKGF